MFGKSLFGFGVLVALIFADGENLKAAILHALEESSNVDVSGVSNCQNKCTQLFGQLSYYTAIQQQLVGGNNEFRACMIGCNRCTLQIANSEDASTCGTYCKTYDYSNPNDGVPRAIVKGVVEADKACLFGCVINLCQIFCTGGDQWGTGGCQIKTGAGIQTYNQVPDAGFNTKCCSDAQNLCKYGGTNSESLVNQKKKF